MFNQDSGDKTDDENRWNCCKSDKFSCSRKRDEQQVGPKEDAPREAG